ncbi:MAG: hypothetical protein OXC01_08250 [Immundisolibacterales bacterium]|nr:hypothetical protein [Immundisolibacterales bacterium]
MAIRLTKPWRALEASEVARLPGQLGVYQIAGQIAGQVAGQEAGRTEGRTEGQIAKEIAGGESEVLCIGVAGGRSLFGLRGELAAELARRGPGFRFRVEVNTQYHTRFRELLMLHRADHGALPPENEAPPGLGRLSPA